MRKLRLALIILVAVLVGISIGIKASHKNTAPSNPSPVALADPEIPFNQIFVKVAEKVKPAVVRVETEAVVEYTSPFNDFFSDPFFRWFFGENPPAPKRKEILKGLGSGFMISPDGYIVTNNHVIEGAKKVTVKLMDGREFKAKIVGADKKSDLALLKIDAKGLPYLKWGDSSKIKVGEWVLAIGNPLGLDYTVTAGIISAKGRQLPLSEYEDFIQTDAAINRGNSGGPLVDLRGEVIGVNSAIETHTGGFMGLGFAIPSNLAKRVIKDLKEKGKVIRPFLGVQMQALTDDMAKALGLKPGTKGAIITNVLKDSPAEKAGLKRYDVVIGVGGKKVKNPLDLKIAIMAHSPGEKITLKVIRNGKEIEVPVVLGSETQAPSFFAGGNPLGIEAAPLTGRAKKFYPYGVQVAKVLPGSPAQRAGIQPGDVILEVNRQPIHSVAEFNAIVSRLKKGDIVLLTVARGEGTFFITLRIE